MPNHVSPAHWHVAALPLTGHHPTCIPHANAMLVAKVFSGALAIRGNSCTAFNIVFDDPAAGLTTRGEIEQQRREKFRAKGG